MTPPSGPTYPLIAGVAQIMGGEDQGKQYFTKLKANGLKEFQTNDPTLDSVSRVLVSLPFADSAIYGAIKAGHPLGIIFPVASGAVGLPGVVSAFGSAQGLRRAVRQLGIVFWRSECHNSS